MRRQGSNTDYKLVIQMPKTMDPEPWRALSSEIADLIEPELPAITEEILATIAREVPEYARPLEGRFGRGIRTGVGEALLQFVSLIREPGRGREPGREVYVELGRGSSGSAAPSTRFRPPTGSAPGWPGGGSRRRGGGPTSGRSR
jgi:hypothetical protein